MSMPVKIFFCYAHEDEALLNKLKTHLRPLQRQGLIDFWNDRDISAGAEWEKEIDKHLNTAEIILLLVSPDFIDSDYCYSKEMKRALERHEKRFARVIPIILRPIYWQGVLGKLQALPTDAKPVISSSWHNPDEALFNVAEGIRKEVEKLIAQKNDAQVIYNQATSGKPFLDDRLSRQNGNKWTEGDYSNERFFFQEDGYHIKTLSHGQLSIGLARSVTFSDFAFQTEMILISGDGGGLVIRAGDTYRIGYRLALNRDYLDVVYDTSELFIGVNFKTQLSRRYLLTAIALKSDLYFYVDKKCVATLNDSSVSAGTIGLMAVDFNNYAHVVFKNAKVWDLTEGLPLFY